MFIIIFFDVATKNVLCMKNKQNINVENMTEKHTCHSTVKSHSSNGHAYLHESIMKCSPGSIFLNMTILKTHFFFAFHI